MVAVFFGVPHGGRSEQHEYQTRSLTREHREAIERSIAECVQQVNSASDLNTRAGYQEELCKRLLQAEDYDNALRVAQSVYQTPRVDAERRAAHHYLIAQIYAMRMKASPNMKRMEENRRLAWETAREILSKSYPDRWMVTDAAKTLLKELQDPAEMQKVVATVKKRESGVRTASVPKRASAEMPEANASAVPSGRGQAATISADASPSLGPSPQAVSGQAAPITEINASARRVYASRNEGGVLKSPVLIDGATVRPAE